MDKNWTERRLSAWPGCYSTFLRSTAPPLLPPRCSNCPGSTGSEQTIPQGTCTPPRTRSRPSHRTGRISHLRTPLAATDSHTQTPPRTPSGSGSPQGRTPPPRRQSPPLHPLGRTWRPHTPREWSSMSTRTPRRRGSGTLIRWDSRSPRRTTQGRTSQERKSIQRRKGSDRWSQPGSRSRWRTLPSWRGSRRRIPQDTGSARTIQRRSSTSASTPWRCLRGNTSRSDTAAPTDPPHKARRWHTLEGQTPPPSTNSPPGRPLAPMLQRDSSRIQGREPEPTCPGDSTLQRDTRWRIQRCTRSLQGRSLEPWRPRRTQCHSSKGSAPMRSHRTTQPDTAAPTSYPQDTTSPRRTPVARQQNCTRTPAGRALQRRSRRGTWTPTHRPWHSPASTSTQQDTRSAQWPSQGTSIRRRTSGCSRSRCSNRSPRTGSGRWSSPNTRCPGYTPPWTTGRCTQTQPGTEPSQTRRRGTTLRSNTLSQTPPRRTSPQDTWSGRTTSPDTQTRCHRPPAPTCSCTQTPRRKKPPRSWRLDRSSRAHRPPAWRAWRKRTPRRTTAGRSSPLDRTHPTGRR